MGIVTSTSQTLTTDSTATLALTLSSQRKEATARALMMVSSFDVVEVLHRTHSEGGTIFAAGDSRSLDSARHLAEEFQVRYRAGQPFSRPDRPAVPSVSLTDFSFEALIKVLSDNLRNSDCLVFFTCGGVKSEALSRLNSAVLERGCRCVFVGPTVDYVGSDISRQTIVSQDGPADNLQFSSHRAVIHGICESFEPEFNAGQGSACIIDALIASALSDRIAADNPQFCSAVDESRKELIRRVQDGGRVYLCGNGGSACDAQELASLLRNRKTSEGANVLAVDMLQAGYLTCAINDGHPLFERFVQGLHSPKDVIIAYSTSGMSNNVIDAVTLAKRKGLFTIGLLGRGGGQMATNVDCPIIVPSDDTGRIQECHAAIGAFFAAGLSS